MRSICSTLKFLGIFLASFSTYAQKLPNVQKASVWAPQNIKIDGKAAEWQDKYEAYNKATDINYTVANDDKNLYLLIKATGSFNIGEKILGAGISFSVNHTLDKKDNAAITLTYPFLQGKARGSLSDLFYGTVGIKMGGNPGGDNSLTRLNHTFTEKFKYIGVKGIKSLSATEISVYNDLGIQAASSFPAPSVYIYELAIPLQLLALPEGGAKGFSYHIKMNAREEVLERFAHPGPAINPDAPPEPAPATSLYTSTDFWGEYTLVKKP